MTAEHLQTVAAIWILVPPALILMVLAALTLIWFCRAAGDRARRAHWNHDALPEYPTDDYLQTDRLEESGERP